LGIDQDFITVPKASEEKDAGFAVGIYRFEAKKHVKRKEKECALTYYTSYG